MREWNYPVWFAALDFKKAFDSVEHTCIWEALHRQGVNNRYIHILAHLYSGQTARVKTDRLSKPFCLRRGTKQGDPLSSLLFNAVLEDIFRDLKKSWLRQGFGLHLGYTDFKTLSNLRFADDVLLAAPSYSKLRKMLRGLVDAAGKRGLELHPEKTKILCNLRKITGIISRTSMEVNGMPIDIFPYSGSAKYLGRKLSFDDPDETELDNRISVGWKKFMLFKTELTYSGYSLRDRLRLFETVVKPTVLYGAAVWTMTASMEHKLQRCQRRMLRMILGHRRRRIQTDESVDGELEPWVDWVKRATREAESKLKEMDFDMWATAQKRMKWSWAQRTQQIDADRWSRIVAEWEPENTNNCTRSQGRPRRRWADDIHSFLATKGFHGSWDAFPGHWHDLEKEFVAYEHQ